MSDRYILIGQTPVPEPDLFKWADWFEHADRVVQQTHLGNVMVSTVFLGLDHSHAALAMGVPHPPILFETMVFLIGRADDYSARCSTWEQAEYIHRMVCRRYFRPWWLVWRIARRALADWVDAAKQGWREIVLDEKPPDWRWWPDE